MVMQTYQRAFTLIELMIVVVVIAILAAIAYPSYQESVRKTKRTDAKADMMALAHNLQRFKIVNFSYMPNGTKVKLADVGFLVLMQMGKLKFLVQVQHCIRSN